MREEGVANGRREGPILLSSGYAPPEAFPGPQLAECAATVLCNQASEALQYGDRFGYLPLRELIVEWLQSDNVPASVEEILIVSGAKQNLDMCARAFCRPGETIVVSEPTYMNGLKLFRTAGATPLPVPSDDLGMNVDALEEILSRLAAKNDPLPKLIYDIPDFHNPSGGVLPLDRRARLIEIASRYGIPILEDNPYRWTRFEGSASLPLKHFDPEGHVIATGTFAKILGPGLRLGWVHARKDLLQRIAAFKAEGGTSPLTQMLAYQFFREQSSLEQHLRVITDILHRRRNALLSSLDRHMGALATWNRPSGGYYVWARLKQDIDTTLVAQEALAAGVKYYPGAVFFASPNPPRNYMRLSYSYENEDRIEEGIALLATVLARHGT